jgi:tetratricopeptide (TPR) repeat protein
LAKKGAAAEEARSDIITGPAAPTPTAAGAALVASAAGGFGGAAGRRLTTLLARKPKVWVVLFLTWLTVIPLFLIGIFTPLPILLLPRGCEPAVLEFQAKYKGMLGLAKANPDGPLPSDGGDAALKQWVDDRLRDADNAIATGDFAGAIDIYQKLIDRTGDARWQARATDLRKRIQQQAEQRLADLTGKLEQAQAMADRHQYDDALAVLRNIGPKDRQLLASKGMDVGKMEGTVLKAQQQYQDALRVQAEKLAASLEDIRKLRAARKLKEALAGYEQILQSFPRDLITQHVNIDKAIRDLKAEIQASAAPTPPPPPVAPVMTEKEIITKVADLMEQAVRLEQQEKFNEALAKLGEVKKFDPKYWPETLEKRIEAVKKKKDALDFFGIGGKK